MGGPVSLTSRSLSLSARCTVVRAAAACIDDVVAIPPALVGKLIIHAPARRVFARACAARVMSACHFQVSTLQTDSPWCEDSRAAASIFIPAELSKINALLFDDKR